MNTTTDAMETTIPKGRTLRIQDGKGLDLQVVTGCLWVTYAQDTADTVLEATDRFRVGRDGLTLVHALREARLRIAYPVEVGAPSLTLGGGYREFSSSVFRAMVAEMARAVRGWFVAGAIRKPKHAHAA